MNCEKHKDTELRWRKDKNGKYCPKCMHNDMLARTGKSFKENSNYYGD